MNSQSILKAPSSDEDSEDASKSAPSLWDQILDDTEDGEDVFVGCGVAYLNSVWKKSMTPSTKCLLSEHDIDPLEAAHMMMAFKQS